VSCLQFISVADNVRDTVAVKFGLRPKRPFARDRVERWASARNALQVRYSTQIADLRRP